MAQKDFSISENLDRGINPQPPENPEAGTGKSAGDGKKTEVKNAHATGDGSFGRNDESLPEEESVPPVADNPY